MRTTFVWLLGCLRRFSWLNGTTAARSPDDRDAAEVAIINALHGSMAGTTAARSPDDRDYVETELGRLTIETRSALRGWLLGRPTIETKIAHGSDRMPEQWLLGHLTIETP